LTLQWQAISFIKLFQNWSKSCGDASASHQAVGWMENIKWLFYFLKNETSIGPTEKPTFI
jgi:hypothetical protein